MTKKPSIPRCQRGAKIVSLPFAVEDRARWPQAQASADDPGLGFRLATRRPDV